MRVFIKRIILFCLTFMFILTAMPSKAEAKVSLNKSSATISVGKTLQLKVSGTSKKVTWSTDDKTVATVSSKGKVKGVSAGVAHIYAKVRGAKYRCTINVKPPKVEVIAFNKYTVNLYSGEEVDLKMLCKVTPSVFDATDLVWISSEPSVAYVRGESCVLPSLVQQQSKRQGMGRKRVLWSMLKVACL